MLTGHAHAASYDVTEGKVEWTATGTPGFLKINGTGGKLVGHADTDAAGKVSGKFTVALADYTTGMSLRDKHMKEKYFDVACSNLGPPPATCDNATATLTLDAWTPTKDASTFTGKLTMKGESKPIGGQASFNDGKLKATFDVVITNYPKIGVPSYLGVTVAKDVAVTVEGTVSAK